MKQCISFISLLVLILTSTNTQAQIHNVDQEIQKTFKYYTGVSLEQAVKDLDDPELSSTISVFKGDVVIILNGGLPAFFGTNTLEILVRNDVPLTSISLGFQFTWESNIIVLWNTNYGNNPPIQENGKDFGILDLEGLKADFCELDGIAPDYISIKGSVQDTLRSIRPYLTTLFSMEFEIIGIDSSYEKGFTIDNVFIPPKGIWEFGQVGSDNYMPSFHGNTNTDPLTPDAPAISFDVLESKIRSRINSEINSAPSFPNESRYYQIRYGHPIRLHNDGIRRLGATIVFEGNDEDLKALGVRFGHFRYSGNSISVIIPLEMLPEVTKVAGVKRIYH